MNGTASRIVRKIMYTTISATCSRLVGSHDTSPLTKSSIDSASIRPPRWSGGHPTAGHHSLEGARDEHGAEQADAHGAHDGCPCRDASGQATVHRRTGLDRPEPEGKEERAKAQSERENERQAEHDSSDRDGSEQRDQCRR